MNLILFVLHDSEKLRDILNAWKEAGANGATVLYSTGMGRLHQNQPLREDLPLIPSLENFLPRVNQMSRTIFSLVDREETVERVIAATESILGPLDQPDRGLLMVLPISRVQGYWKKG